MKLLYITCLYFYYCLIILIIIEPVLKKAKEKEVKICCTRKKCLRQSKPLESKEKRAIDVKIEDSRSYKRMKCDDRSQINKLEVAEENVPIVLDDSKGNLHFLN